MYRIQIKDMDFEQIARSGQCFRMEGRDVEKGVWSIASAGEYVEAVKDGDSFLFSCGEREFKETWAGYFDLQTDYVAAIKNMWTLKMHILGRPWNGAGVSGSFIRIYGKCW